MHGVRWPELLGYAGALLMFSTFYMSTMMRLRVVGIAANVFMIAYTGIMHVIPVLVLQSCLLPLNVYRLLQMRNLVKKVKDAAAGEFDVKVLAPFMTRERHARGDVLFRAGDPANRMYVVQSGQVRLAEIDLSLGPGTLIGEIGVLAPSNTRTATAVCDDECEVLSMTQERVVQMYYQDPRFGFFLMRLITSRLLANAEQARVR